MRGVDMAGNACQAVGAGPDLHVRHVHRLGRAVLRRGVGVRRLGRAVQVDCIKTCVEGPWFQRLKLDYDETLTNFAFNFNLRRCTSVVLSFLLLLYGTAGGAVYGRGLHSSNFRLNVSALCGMGGASRGCSGDV
jgi:hypothetical protein